MDIREFLENYKVEIWEVRNAKTGDFIEYKLCLLEYRQTNIEWASIATDVSLGKFNRAVKYCHFFVHKEDSLKTIIKQEGLPKLKGIVEKAQELSTRKTDVEQLNVFSIRKIPIGDRLDTLPNKLVNPEEYFYLKHRVVITLNTSSADVVTLRTWEELIETLEKEYEFLENEEKNTKKLTEAQADLLELLGGK